MKKRKPTEDRGNRKNWRGKVSIFTALALVLWLTGAVMPFAAQASSTTLDSVSDNRIVRQAPTDNYGTATIVAIQVYGTTGRQRSLVKFDLSSIPSGATLNTATLKLKTGTCIVGTCTGRTVYANRLTHSWTETGSTWNKYDGTTNWGTAGGDYTTSGRASSTVPTMGSWEEWDVKTIAQAWVDGTSNYGFLLIDSNEAYGTNTCWTYGSRESTDDPELYIEYIIDSWESYNCPGHTPECQDDTFSGDKHTVYMHGTGFLTSHLYKVAYYDAGAANNHIETDTLNSVAGNLDSECVFTSYPASRWGTWHAIVCEGTVDPPSTYDSGWAYIIADDSFTVEESAIPEFPTVIAAIAVCMLCAVTYMVMRRKAGKR